MQFVPQFSICRHKNNFDTLFAVESQISIDVKLISTDDLWNTSVPGGVMPSVFPIVFVSYPFHICVNL